MNESFGKKDLTYRMKTLDFGHVHPLVRRKSKIEPRIEAWCPMCDEVIACLYDYQEMGK
jgi:hypothetical protein